MTKYFFHLKDQDFPHAYIPEEDDVRVFDEVEHQLGWCTVQEVLKRPCQEPEYDVYLGGPKHKGTFPREDYHVVGNVLWHLRSMKG